MPSVYISQTGAGPTEIIPATAGKRIFITSLVLTGNGDSEVTLKDGAGSPVSLTGAIIVSGGGLVWRDADSQVASTVSTNVTLTKSEGVTKVVGHVSYEVY